MKIRTDFVTNSSSSSFVLEIRIELKDKKNIVFNATAEGEECDPTDLAELTVSVSPRQLGTADSVAQLVSMLKDGVTEYGSPVLEEGGGDAAWMRRGTRADAYRNGSRFIRELAQIPNMDAIKQITIKGEESDRLNSYYREYIYSRETGKYTARIKGGEFEKGGGQGGDLRFSDVDIIEAFGPHGRIIPDGITTIENAAFKNCKDLAVVIVPDTVTSIGDEAFSGCSSLKRVIIPNGVTQIGQGAFSGCVSLANVTIPNSVTTIGDGAFWSCSGLKSVIIPKSVKSISDYTFKDCRGVTNITIPESVLSIGYRAFEGCRSLANITIPERVKSIGYEAFSSCSSLTRVTIPESVTDVGERAFFGCKGLKSVTISGKETIIGESAFYGCTGLADMKGFVIVAEEIFSCNSPIGNITLPDHVTRIGREAFSGCHFLKTVTIPKNVTIIGKGAFRSCDSLTEVIIPDSVAEIRDNAFEGCRNLKRVTLSKNLTKMGIDVFKLCYGLEEIVVPTEALRNGLKLPTDFQRLPARIDVDGVAWIALSYSGMTWEAWMDQFISDPSAIAERMIEIMKELLNLSRVTGKRVTRFIRAYGKKLSRECVEQMLAMFDGLGYKEIEDVRAECQER